jgi:hypothetical protein
VRTYLIDFEVFNNTILLKEGRFLNFALVYAFAMLSLSLAASCRSLSRIGMTRPICGWLQVQVSMCRTTRSDSVLEPDDLRYEAT